MADRVTSGTMVLILPYNTGTSPLKVFDFLLTSARRVDQEGSFATPRLATPTPRAMVTIVDGEGGAGVFEFVVAETSIQEDGSPLAQGVVNRTAGSVGVVTVQLSITEERADGSQRKNLKIKVTVFYNRH